MKKKNKHYKKAKQKNFALETRQDIVSFPSEIILPSINNDLPLVTQPINQPILPTLNFSNHNLNSLIRDDSSIIHDNMLDFRVISVLKKLVDNASSFIYEHTSENISSSKIKNNISNLKNNIELYESKIDKLDANLKSAKNEIATLQDILLEKTNQKFKKHIIKTYRFNPDNGYLTKRQIEIVKSDKVGKEIYNEYNNENNILSSNLENIKALSRNIVGLQDDIDKSRKSLSEIEIQHLRSQTVNKYLLNQLNKKVKQLIDDTKILHKKMAEEIPKSSYSIENQIKDKRLQLNVLIDHGKSLILPDFKDLKPGISNQILSKKDFIGK